LSQQRSSSPVALRGMAVRTLSLRGRWPLSGPCSSRCRSERRRPPRRRPEVDARHPPEPRGPEPETLLPPRLGRWRAPLCAGRRATHLIVPFSRSPEAWRTGTGGPDPSPPCRSERARWPLAGRRGRPLPAWTRAAQARRGRAGWHAARTAAKRCGSRMRGTWRRSRGRPARWRSARWAPWTGWSGTWPSAGRSTLGARPTGTWVSTTWASGTGPPGTWPPGMWWASGTWRRGTWPPGMWVSGTWPRETWPPGTWRVSGTWSRGTWRQATGRQATGRRTPGGHPHGSPSSWTWTPGTRPGQHSAGERRGLAPSSTPLGRPCSAGTETPPGPNGNEPKRPSQAWMRTPAPRSARAGRRRPASGWPAPSGRRRGVPGPPPCSRPAWA
jgi:hypothetical protein